MSSGAVLTFFVIALVDSINPSALQERLNPACPVMCYGAANQAWKA